MVVPNQEPKKPAKPGKSSERSFPVPVPASAAALNVINPDAAGIDVHSNMHMVCVPADRDADPVRQFGANTADLHEIVAWLKKCRIKTIALESTGVYWIALFELLESEGFEVHLVEPGQLSRCGARPKTDVLDVQWIQRLHSYGLLRASFRPPDFVLAVRAYWRLRQMQIRYAAQSCPAHAEGHGADERQTDGGRQQHHGAYRHVDHQCHPGGATRPQRAG